MIGLNYPFLFEELIEFIFFFSRRFGYFIGLNLFFFNEVCVFDVHFEGFWTAFLSFFFFASLFENWEKIGGVWYSGWNYFLDYVFFFVFFCFFCLFFGGGEGGCLFWFIALHH